MDIKTYVKRWAIWTAVVIAVIVALCGIFFGKVVEETLFLEIAKWVVMYVAITGIIVEPWVIFLIAPTVYHQKYDKKK